VIGSRWEIDGTSDMAGLALNVERTREMTWGGDAPTTDWRGTRQPLSRFALVVDLDLSSLTSSILLFHLRDLPSRKKRLAGRIGGLYGMPPTREFAWSGGLLPPAPASIIPGIRRLMTFLERTVTNPPTDPLDRLEPAVIAS
jgi:hypothetical protein